MKKKLLFFWSAFLMISTIHAQVGINTTTPNPNAVLHVESHFGGGNYGGFMPPKVTLTQRNAISVTFEDDGLMLYVIYPNNNRCLQIFNGASLSWEDIRCFSTPVLPTVRELRIGADYPSTNPSSYMFSSGDIIYANTSSGGLPNRNTANICVGASYRFQLSSFILFNVGTSVSHIVIHGTSSGAGLRTVTNVEVSETLNGTYIPVSGYTSSSSLEGNTLCNTATINNIAIPPNSFIRFTFSGAINLSGFDLTSP
jgi:hypothetical protein